MKSLNDIIWNGDIDLEGEKNNIEIQGMGYACLEDSCGLGLDCIFPSSYVFAVKCTK